MKSKQRVLGTICASVMLFAVCAIALYRAYPGNGPLWVLWPFAFTGLDEKVKQYLCSYAEVEEMFEDICRFLQKWLPRFVESNRSYMTVAIGCTGGQHRSVYVTEELVARLLKAGVDVQKRHLEID